VDRQETCTPLASTRHGVSITTSGGNAGTCLIGYIKCALCSCPRDQRRDQMDCAVEYTRHPVQQQGWLVCHGRSAYRRRSSSSISLARSARSVEPGADGEHRSCGKKRQVITGMVPVFPEVRERTGLLLAAWSIIIRSTRSIWFRRDPTPRTQPRWLRPTNPASRVSGATPRRRGDLNTHIVAGCTSNGLDAGMGPDGFVISRTGLVEG